MSHHAPKLGLAAFASACLTTLALAGPADDAAYAIIDGEKVDVPKVTMGAPATIAAIIEEGSQRNRVMDHLTYLCEEIGPRLTGSSNVEEANNWVADQFRAWGLTNVHLDEWGEIGVRFDRGPSSGKVVVARQRDDDEGNPYTEWVTQRELQFTTLAWSPGTAGPVRGHVVKMPADEDEYWAVKDKLKGAWVLLQAPQRQRGVRGSSGSMSGRTQQLAEARAKVAAGEVEPEDLDLFERIAFDGINGFVSTSRDERIWTTSVRGWRELSYYDLPKDIIIDVTGDDYDYINSRVFDGEAIELCFDLRHHFTEGPIKVYNTIGEIRGTEKPEEVVIVSGHLDSWNGPGSQGTVDNGTGSSVTMEAARILATVGAKPKRTIRFILWTGEEQGLLGSRDYVERLQASGEIEKISAVFVDDGGTNYEGGITGTPDMVPWLAAATAPVNGVFYSETDGQHLDVNVKTMETFNMSVGGSDHASFVRARVPGFFWDEVGRANYRYAWHTQRDRLDQAIEEYLVQSATCAAVTAYNIACAPGLLPRPAEWLNPQEEGQEESPGERPQRPERRGDAAASATGATR
ncbi:MAG: M20/M25/M40 family metallo-hydrolase [Phycisphaerales bacterium JB039]